MNTFIKLNSWYDRLHEPWRFCVAMLLCSPSFIAIQCDHDRFAIMYFCLLIVGRILYVLSPSRR